MQQNMYGYARVSTQQQHTDRQLATLLEFGVRPKQIYTDKQSGKNFNRPAYIRLLRHLRCGDVLVIPSIDRLGRNYKEILEQWNVITRKKQVDIIVLDMPLLDTRKGEDITGTLISDIVLQLLSYVAHIERDNIRKRQSEGVAEAKKRGVRFGRPPRALPQEFEEICAQVMRKECTQTAAAIRMGIPRTTFLDMLRRYRKKTQ